MSRLPGKTDRDIKFPGQRIGFIDIHAKLSGKIAAPRAIAFDYNDVEIVAVLKIVPEIPERIAPAAVAHQVRTFIIQLVGCAVDPVVHLIDKAVDRGIVGCNQPALPVFRLIFVIIEPERI